LLKIVLATGEQFAIAGVPSMKRQVLASENDRERKLSLKALVTSLLRSRGNALGRRQLLDLNDHLLRDVGLSRHEVLYGAEFRSEKARKGE
jgi:uncharacterized protein YjiS (DUF1127 family)